MTSLPAPIPAIETERPFASNRTEADPPGRARVGPTSALRRSATFNHSRRMSAAADLHRMTVTQPTSAIRPRSSRAAGLHPANSGRLAPLRSMSQMGLPSHWPMGQRMAAVPGRSSGKCDVAFGRCKGPPHGLVLNHRLPVRVEGFAGLTAETPNSVGRPERYAFRLLCDCREGQHGPVVLRQYVADEVVLMQTLHDDDDAAGAFVVEAGEQRVVVPFVDRLSTDLGERLIRLQRAVDHDDVSTVTGPLAISPLMAWRESSRAKGVRKSGPSESP
jgi:hypothetical protein